MSCFALKRVSHGLARPSPGAFWAWRPSVLDSQRLTGEGDTVLDPFAGSCTTGEAAERLSRRWVGFEPVPEYLDGARLRFERSDVAPEEAPTVAIANISRAPHRQIALL